MNLAPLLPPFVSAPVPFTDFSCLPQPPQILRRIAAEPNTVAAAAAPASSGNILDMSAPAPSSEPAATGLFAGMQTAAAPTSAAPQATAPSAATTAPAAAGGSMFAGMNMGGAAPDVAAAPTSSASSGLEDLMGGLVTGGPAAGPAAAPGGVGAVNLLGDMQETTQPASFDPLADLMGSSSTPSVSACHPFILLTALTVLQAAQPALCQCDPPPPPDTHISLTFPESCSHSHLCKASNSFQGCQ